MAAWRTAHSRRLGQLCCSFAAFFWIVCIFGSSRKDGWLLELKGSSAYSLHCPMVRHQVPTFRIQSGHPPLRAEPHTPLCIITSDLPRATLLASFSTGVRLGLPYLVRLVVWSFYLDMIFRFIWRAIYLSIWRPAAESHANYETSFVPLEI